MIGICKLLFDISFYYAISAYFMYLTTESFPLAWGIAFIIFPAAVHLIVMGKTTNATKTIGFLKVKPLTVVCCAMPAFFMALRPGIGQIIQFVPAWAYLGFTIWENRFSTTRSLFGNHFSFTGKLYCLFLFGVVAINSGRVGSAINGAVPYIIIYLLTGVCLMRVLREEGKLKGRRNVIILIVMLLGCIILVSLQAPQLFMSALGFLYKNVISWIIMGLVYFAAAIMIVAARAIIAIISIFVKGGNYEVPVDLSGSAQEVFGGDSEYFERNIAWLEVFATIVLVAAVGLVLFLIARKLLGQRPDGTRKSAYSVEQEKLEKGDKGRMGGLLRPKDPRQAVRWYYRKYLKEGASRRGAKHALSDTSLDVLEKFDPFFPGDDAESLRGIYLMARYNQTGDVLKQKADFAADLWSNLKAASAPKEALSKMQGKVNKRDLAEW